MGFVLVNCYLQLWGSDTHRHKINTKSKTHTHMHFEDKSNFKKPGFTDLVGAEIKVQYDGIIRLLSYLAT